MLNEGMFADTGGWALKPKGYRCTTSTGASQKEVKPKKHQLSLEIRLYAAQRLSLPAEKDSSHGSKLKPYVKAQLHADSDRLSENRGSPDGSGNGTSADEVAAHGGEEKDSGIYKRRSVTCRTDSPNFNGEVLSWLHVPNITLELSFIRYVIFSFHQHPKCPLFQRYLRCCSSHAMWKACRNWHFACCRQCCWLC